MNEIDRLYQLPLAEFTPARNALAKQSKDQRAAITALQKPALPAWAVNQLYWHRRPVYDALAAATERVRAAQTAAMRGQRADVSAAESTQGAALKAALQEVRQLLGEAGETASAATMIAVSETLQALPSGDPPGRLVRPLKPMGLEALTRLLTPDGTTGAATVLAFPSKSAKKTPQTPPPVADPGASKRARAEAERIAETAKREAEARARELKLLEAELRDARAAEQSAEAAAGRARTAASAADRDHQDLLRRVDAAAEEAARLAKDAASKDRAVTAASVARQRLEARWRALTTEP